MITELRLKNFKCLKEDFFPLSKINVFAGRNGIGKSSLLQSMLLIAQSLDDNGLLKKVKINGTFLQLGTFCDIISKDGNDSRIIIKLTSDDSPEGDFVELILAKDQESQYATIADLRTPQTDSSLDVPSANTGNSEASISFGAQASVDVTSALPPLMQLQNVYFVSADRRGPVNTQKLDASALLSNVGIHGENVLNVLYRGGKNLQQRVQDALTYIMKQSSLNVKEVNNDIQLFLDSVNNSNGFKPVNVGFGYSYLLTILLTMLVAEPKSKVFIENPEAHLHPGAQSRLIDFLFKTAKEKNFQLFIETHSENVFNAIRRAALSGFGIEPEEVKSYFFYDSGENQLGYKEIKMGKDGSLNDFPADFFDQTRQELREIMNLVNNQKSK